MAIRDLRWEDFEALVATYYLAYDERDRGEVIGLTLFDERPSRAFEVDWFARVYKDAQAGVSVALVAEADGAVVGSCFVWPKVAGSEIAHVGVLGILVHPAHRGKGFGAELIRAALQRSRGKFDSVQLEVLSTNGAARRLYERLGFRTIGLMPRGHRRGGRFADVEWMLHPLR